MRVITVSDNEYKSWEVVIEFVKIIGASLAFWFALAQYKKAQQWKRKEYTSNLMERFLADQDVQLSMQMLDWMERQLTLKSGKQYDFRSKSLTKILASSAKSNELSFSQEESELRDSFSKFLDCLQQIDADIEAGLIKAEEVKVYLYYWLQKLSTAQGKQDEASLQVISGFIDDYEYAGVRRLVKRYSGENLLTQLERWTVRHPVLVK
jgi:hypothetical protein